jgi:hypothetical protein
MIKHQLILIFINKISRKEIISRIILLKKREIIILMIFNSKIFSRLWVCLHIRPNKTPNSIILIIIMAQRMMLRLHRIVLRVTNNNSKVNMLLEILKLCPKIVQRSLLLGVKLMQIIFQVLRWAQISGQPHLRKHLIFLHSNSLKNFRILGIPQLYPHKDYRKNNRVLLISLENPLL